MHKDVKLINFSKKLKLTNQNDCIMTAPRFQIFLNLLKWGYKLGNSGLLERNEVSTYNSLKRTVIQTKFG